MRQVLSIRDDIAAAIYNRLVSTDAGGKGVVSPADDREPMDGTIDTKIGRWPKNVT